MTLKSTTCGHNGGQGIGAGHVCLCTRKPNHPNDSERPHGCTCGALWADTPTRSDPMTQADDEFDTMVLTTLSMMGPGSTSDLAKRTQHPHWRLQASLVRLRQAGSIEPTSEGWSAVAYVADVSDPDVVEFKVQLSRAEATEIVNDMDQIRDAHDTTRVLMATVNEIARGNQLTVRSTETPR